MSLFAPSSAGAAAWIHPPQIFAATAALRKDVSITGKAGGVLVPGVQHQAGDQALAILKTVVEGVAGWFQEQGATMAGAVDMAATRIVEADGGPR